MDTPRRVAAVYHLYSVVVRGESVRESFLVAAPTAPPHIRAFSHVTRHR